MPSYKLYETLGVSKEANAKELKKAFHRLSLEHHPDKGGNPDTFKEISHAYQILSDEEKRQLYDQLGDERFNAQMTGGGPGGMGGIDPRDLFAQFFGGGGFPFGGMGMGGGSAKSADHRHVWNISLHDAYFGIEKTLKVSVQRPCRSCMETCYTCQGRGVITQMNRMGMFAQISTSPCHVCKGMGRSVSKAAGNCSECGGRGQVAKEHRVELKAPAGVATGHLIRVSGLGEQSPERDDLNGDLLVEVMVQTHPLFVREGDNLHMTVPIGFIETMTGKKISISHFTGDLEIDTANLGIIQPNKIYMIPNKGMPGGHLCLKFMVEYPKEKLTDTQRDAIRKVWGSLL